MEFTPHESVPTYTRVRQQISGLDVFVDCPGDQYTPTHLFVLLHGYGSHGGDLASLGPALRQTCCSDEFLPVFFFPYAPISLEPLGMPGGYAWWPLRMEQLMEAAQKGTFDELRNEKPTGLEEASKAVNDLVSAGFEKYPSVSQKLILGGFSQGCMLAMQLACCQLATSPLALLLYSGALINEDQWQTGAKKLDGVKAIQSHGRLDQILPIETGKSLSELLHHSPCENEFIEFDGFHEIPHEALGKTIELLRSL